MGSVTALCTVKLFTSIYMRLSWRILSMELLLANLLQVQAWSLQFMLRKMEQKSILLGSMIIIDNDYHPSLWWYTTLVFAIPTFLNAFFYYRIVGSGTEYRIDSKIVSPQQYTSKLESLGILVKAKNFLVFQVMIMHMVKWKLKN